MRLRLALGVGAWLCALLIGAAVQAADPSGAVVMPDRSPTWASLTPAQRQTLAPLQRDWAALEPARKLKWLEVASRFPRMPADERLRVQERMAQWARMTPAERTLAREQFQQVRQLPLEERQARWQAYQALPDEERRKLAQSARPASASKGASAPDAAAKGRLAAGGADNAKRNLLQPTTASGSRAVAPVVVQAKPGATTTTMSVRAAPPPHTQPGLPKIAATPGYVDAATLLPRRGPQGAAVRATAVVEPTEQP